MFTEYAMDRLEKEEKDKLFCAECGKLTKHKKCRDKLSHWFVCQEHKQIDKDGE